MNDFPSLLPLGILTSRKGQTTIEINGFMSLDIGDDLLYFKDLKEDKTLLIEDDNFTYNFNNQEGNQEGRFFLQRVLRNSTQIEDLKTRTIVIYKEGSLLYINSLDGSDLKEVSLMNLSGQILYKKLNSSGQQVIVPADFNTPVVIVKAATEKSTETQKVILK